ncbi:MAG: OsmC family protein [Tahibacter sp.]
MSEHHTTLQWSRADTAFERGNYVRDHEIRFEGGQTVRNSAAVGYGGDANASNPEELLLAALSSCHMLTFLAIVANRGYVVDQYVDAAVAMLDKNADGKMAVTRAILNPRIQFSDGNQPSSEELATLHQRAHANCFIANSVRCEVEIRT